MSVPRYRRVEAARPDAEPIRRPLPRKRRRQRANVGRLFAQLVEQRPTPVGEEFVFRGDREAIWQDLSVFVDEESQRCPFLTFEQVERADGALLRVSGRIIQER